LLLIGASANRDVWKTLAVGLYAWQIR